MSILFKCSSLYTIFTSAVLCELCYEKEEKILLLSGQSNSIMRKFFEIFQKEKIFFNEIIVLNETSVDVKDIEDDIKKIIKDYDIDVFHMFLYDTYSICLQRLLPLKTKIIFTEEGTMTYCLKENYEIQSKTIFFCNNLKEKMEMNWERIDEILLYEPKAFDNSINTKVNKIDIGALLKDDKRRENFLRKINKFFHYVPEKEEYDVVYFDTNLCETGDIQPDFERRFLGHLLDIIEESNYVIKLHPHETKDFYKFRYNNRKVRIQNNTFLPWEIIFLNRMHNNPMQKLLIISSGSTAEYNSIILSNMCFPNVVFISLLKIMWDYLTEKGIMAQEFRDTDIFYSMLNEKHKYQPKSFQDFQKIFSEYIGKPRLKQSFNQINEINWLRERCIRKGIFLNSIIEECELIIKNENETIIDQVAIYDYTDNIIQVYFEFPMLLKEQEYEFEWKVAKNISCEKVQIDKIYALKQETYERDLDKEILNIKYNILEKGKENLIIGKLCVNEPINNICIRFKVINLKIAEGLLKSSTLENRNQLYYDLLYKWISLKQKDFHFLSFLQNKNYKKIAIYGYGKIGKLLYEEIKDLDLKIAFLQKEGSYITEEGIKIFGMEELRIDKNKFDLIIITPIYEGEKIKSDLIAYYSGEIIILNDLLEIINNNI